MMRSALLFSSAAAAFSDSGDCLCVFDVDRTLTGQQDDTSDCPDNKVVPGVVDTAYLWHQKGNLTLSTLVQGIGQSFCKDCYSGIVSAGTCSGSGSGERKELLKQLQQQTKLTADTWTDDCPSPVTSPLVLGCRDGKKQNTVRDVVDWYKSQNIVIADKDVHFFDDRDLNIQPFADTGFNARQISCKSRITVWGKKIGLCGGAAEELVPDTGVVLCSSTITV